MGTQSLLVQCTWHAFSLLLLFVGFHLRVISFTYFKLTNKREKKKRLYNVLDNRKEESQ